MKILHVINHTGRFNGNVHAAVDLACAQADGGHRVLLLSRGGDFDDTLREHGVGHLNAPIGRSPRQLGGGMARLAAVLRSERPDVVHAHMVTAALLAWPACKLHGVPLVATCHNAFERSAVLMRVADRVIAVSGAVATSLERRGIPASKIRVVLNGTIGVARRSGGPPAPVTLRRPAIAYVGGLHSRKGVADLLDAFTAIHAHNERCHLYIVGEGPMLERYQAIVDGRSYRANVSFLGAVPDPRAYLAADVFVLPSLADPAPLVISEAREAGCAIVASDVDGIPEMLENGRAGILVPPRAPDALAAAVLRVLETEDSLSLWRSRSQINLGKLTIARAAAETLAVYRDCRGRKGEAEEGCAADLATPVR